MTAPLTFKLIGSGVYALPEAERLIGIPRKRIRRWLEGYEFVSRGRRHRSPPVIVPAIGRDAGELALTFADLIEVRFLERFLEKRVPWKTMRVAAVEARELLGVSHPFSTKRFKTDGRNILLELADRDDIGPGLLNVVGDQFEFSRIVRPMLIGLEYEEDEAARWWPMRKSKGVVLDPQRSFGAPIVSEVGIPTEVLARAVLAEGSQREAATAYDVPLRAVERAVEYETEYLKAA
jgi:uncharacterized protein (DUF433 family)